MLGSPPEADDAVQEAWLRLSRAETRDVENLRRLVDHGGRPRLPGHVALAPVPARGVALPRRRRRRLRAPGTGPSPTASCGSPIRSGSRCWWCWRPSPPPSGSPSCCTICSTSPSTRSRPSSSDLRPPPASSPAAPAAASRAAPAVTEADRTRQRQVVDAFLAAARGGDFEALLAALDPEVVLRADPRRRRDRRRPRRPDRGARCCARARGARRRWPMPSRDGPAARGPPWSTACRGRRGPRAATRRAVFSFTVRRRQDRRHRHHRGPRPHPRARGGPPRC